MAGHLRTARAKQETYWHALPVGWEQLDYQTFLDRRRPLLAKVVRDGFGSCGANPVSLSTPGPSAISSLRASLRWSEPASGRRRWGERCPGHHVGTDAEPAVVVDAGDDLGLGAVDQAQAADDVHLP